MKRDTFRARRIGARYPTKGIMGVLRLIIEVKMSNIDFENLEDTPKLDLDTPHTHSP